VSRSGFRRATIVGCGLIGGSFGLALKKKLNMRVAGWDVSEEILNQALSAGIIDETDTAFANQKVSESDLLYLAMPVDRIIDFLHTNSANISPDAVVTDAGSTKVEICRSAQEQIPNHTFIGGHPVAGSHLGGLSHSREDLFEGAAYILTPFEKTRGLDQLQNLLLTIGAKVKLLTPAEHDRAMAIVSHLPQLISSSLAGTVRELQDSEKLIELSGSGFKDMTRLSASSWSIWREILKTNREEILTALELFSDNLEKIRKELGSIDPGSDASFDYISKLFKS
jgi:prephenate dehydrogenase